MGGGGGVGRRGEAFVKIEKQKKWRGVGASLWGQGGCEWRSEVFVKIQKKYFFLGGTRSGGGVDQGVEWGRGSSKVWCMWGMWGMGDVNQE